MTPALARAGIEAADEFLKSFFGLSPLSKAPSVLTPVGFDHVVLQLLGELQKETGGTTQKALTGFLQKLDKDWPGMTPEGRSKAISEAGRTYLGLSAELGPTVGAVLKKEGPTIVGNTKADSRRRDKLDIGIELSGVDHRVLEAASTHQALFVRDQFGVRSDRYSQIARDIVSKGLEDGLDRYDIGGQLSDHFGQTDSARNDAYWQMIASAFTARARTYGQLSGFAEAGIETFQFESVLDQRTSEVCRFMHGRTFSVSKGLQGFADTAASENPEDVKTFQPWGSVGRDEEGRKGIFIGSGEGRALAATIEVSGAGQKDGIGQYKPRMSDGDMDAAGFSAPPLHGHCRSTIIPVFESQSVSAPVPPTVEAPPPPPKPTRTPRAPKPSPASAGDVATLASPWTVVDPLSLVAPPPLVVSEPPVPGKNPLPIFTNEAGDRVRPFIDLSGHTQQTLGKLYATKEPKLLAGFGKALDPKSFDAAVYERDLKAVLPKKGGLAELAQTKGEIVTLRAEDLKAIAPPPGVNRDTVAGHIAGGTGRPFSPRPNPQTADEAKTYPLIVRSQGKLFVQAGAEQIVADRMVWGNQFSAHVRVVDLDKCIPGVPLDDAARKSIAARAAPAASAVAKKTATGAEQQALRESARDILRSHNVVTRDDRRKGSGFAFWVEKPAGMDKVLGTDPGAGSFATHGWDGAVKIRPDVAADAAKALGALAKNPNAFRDLPGQEVTSIMHGVETVVHEELHGASNARNSAYRDHGVGIEESATEVLARKMTRELAGQKLSAGNVESVAFPLPTLQTTGHFAGRYRATGAWQSYDEEIGQLFTHTAAVSGHEGIHERVEGAFLKMREWDGAVRDRSRSSEGNGWASGSDQCEAYARALGLNAADQKKLVDLLIADPGFR